MVKERPILFSAADVRAVLEGRKTQARRVLKFQPGRHSPDGLWSFCVSSTDPNDRDTWSYRYPDRAGNTHSIRGREKCVARQKCLYGRPGHRLWVRETWAGNEQTKYYRADGDILGHVSSFNIPDRWRPSIHMPRWASRITLEVTGVRVERLQTISANDAHKEGIADPTEPFPMWGLGGGSGLEAQAQDRWHKKYGKNPWVEGFRALWESSNGSGSWRANPWVWVIDFKQVPNV